MNTHTNELGMDRTLAKLNTHTRATWQTEDMSGGITALVAPWLSSIYCVTHADCQDMTPDEPYMLGIYTRHEWDNPAEGCHTTVFPNLETLADFLTKLLN